LLLIINAASQSSSWSSYSKAGKAVLIGHLVASIPVFLIILSFAVGGFIISLRFSGLKFFLISTAFGFVLSWLWLSLVVPRWRQWALEHGAPAEQLHKIAVATGLVWPEGSIISKTKFKLTKKKVE